MTVVVRLCAMTRIAWSHRWAEAGAKLELKAVVFVPLSALEGLADKGFIHRARSAHFHETAVAKESLLRLEKPDTRSQHQSVQCRISIHNIPNDIVFNSDNSDLVDVESKSGGPGDPSPKAPLS